LIFNTGKILFLFERDKKHDKSDMLDVHDKGNKIKDRNDIMIKR